LLAVYLKAALSHRQNALSFLPIASNLAPTKIFCEHNFCERQSHCVSELARDGLIPDNTSSPELPQARLQLRRQTVQHLAAGCGLHHRLSRFLCLRVNGFDPTTHSLRALGLMRGGLGCQTDRRMYLLHRSLH
jgi:hypothetical protein